MKKYLIIIILYVITTISTSFADTLSKNHNKKTVFPVSGKYGMISAPEKLAAQSGLDILKEGGNAIDAAIAIGFMLAVTQAQAGNLGGGGFMMIYLAKTKEVIAIDYREKAPEKSFKDMFLDKKGNVDEKKILFSSLSSGVPGTVAGLSLALENYGTISLKRTLRDAINTAKNGFSMMENLYRICQRMKKHLKKDPKATTLFFDIEGNVKPIGTTIIQSDLAWSLSQISNHGSNAFYNGEISKKIISFMKKKNGLITKKDLTNYSPIIRKPIEGTYRGYKIFSMPPPSSGGVHLIQMLNILENFPLKEWGHNSAKTLHVMIESMRFAYADRSQHLGDSNFYPVPIKKLTSKSYAKSLANQIDQTNANKSSEIKPGKFSPYESPQTTHFTVIDKWGNAVSNTYTLNLPFGNNMIVPGTGFFLNNEMDDFSAKAGHANIFGLIGGEANSIEPKKRPLSSMTPTLVLKNNELFLATGSPGGSQIITTILQILLNVIDHDFNIAEASNAARIHHQWLPDTVIYEKGISLNTYKILEGQGHILKTQRYPIGKTTSILRKNGFLYGATDPRFIDGISIGF